MNTESTTERADAVDWTREERDGIETWTCHRPSGYVATIRAGGGEVKARLAKPQEARPALDETVRTPDADGAVRDLKARIEDCLRQLESGHS